MAKKYLTKRDNLGTISIWDLDGSIDDIVDMLNEYRDDWVAKGYTEVGLEPDSHPDGDSTFWLYGLRPETDTERNKRLNAVKKAREVKEAQKKSKEETEIKELERLLEKHGDKLKSLFK